MNNSRRLTRPQNGSIIAGVCLGIADYFGLDPSLVRIAYILLTIFTAFSGGIIYLIMWLIVPRSA